MDLFFHAFYRTVQAKDKLLDVKSEKLLNLTPWQLPAFCILGIRARFSIRKRYQGLADMDWI